MKWLFLTVIAALGVSLAGQQPAQKPATADAPDTRIILEVNRVDMLFTVTDKKGRFITDLGKDDFLVVENKRPQTIAEFSAESDLPLRIAILVDTSNSIRDRFRFEQQAAVDFINSVIRPRQDKAMIVSFDSSAELVSDLIDEPDKLAQAIRSLRPGGGTALYDALYYACRDKLQLDKPKYRFRRAVVIVSDGDDNQSRVSRDQALEMAQKADAVIYCISTNISRIESDGDKVLKYLARETGGQSFFPFKAEDLAQSFENIANELRHQYAIFYRPDPFRTDGLYHTVDLRVKSRKDVVVRARKGYYAPKM
ncbi:MAG TPA: VWA domain-containing protein [Bryobacteraceae bacterium]|nr:VWA domain-containing protein [Bryobacteraceae bacterium]